MVFDLMDNSSMEHVGVGRFAQLVSNLHVTGRDKEIVQAAQNADLRVNMYLADFRAAFHRVEDSERDFFLRKSVMRRTFSCFSCMRKAAAMNRSGFRMQFLRVRTVSRREMHVQRDEEQDDGEGHGDEAAAFDEARRRAASTWRG